MKKLNRKFKFNLGNGVLVSDGYVYEIELGYLVPNGLNNSVGVNVPVFILVRFDQIVID